MIVDADVLDFYADVPEGGVCGVVGLPGWGKSESLKLADESDCFGHRVLYDAYLLRDRKRSGRQWRGRDISSEWFFRHPDVLGQEDRLNIFSATLEKDDMADDFTAIAKICWGWADLTLLVEEVGLFGRRAADICNQLSSGGRHAGLRLFLTAQSVTRMERDLRRHFSHLVIFSVSDEADIRELKPRLGAEGIERCIALQKGDPPVLWTAGA